MLVHSFCNWADGTSFQMTNICPCPRMSPEIVQVTTKPLDRIQDTWWCISIRFYALGNRRSPIKVLKLADGLYKCVFPMFFGPAALEFTVGPVLRTSKHSKTSISRIDGCVHTAEIQFKILFEHVKKVLTLLWSSEQKLITNGNNMQRLLLITAGIK